MTIISYLAGLRVGNGVDEPVKLVAHVLGSNSCRRALEVLFGFTGAGIA